MVDADRSIAGWLLLDGDRHLVAAILLLGIFLLLLELGLVGVISAEGSAVHGVATGMIPGLFTFLSIVLAINQLVLSQEFNSASEARERVEDVRDFRGDVEEMADTAPGPVLPTRFLTVVVGTIGAKAETLRESVPETTDEESLESITSHAESVVADAREAYTVLQRTEPGRVNAVLSVLQYEDSRQLYEARRLRQDYGEAFSEETHRALADLIDAIELFSIARTQFRTTYTQRVLARLSRLLLYVGIPALLASIVLGLVASSIEPLPRLHRSLVVSVLLTIALSPLAVLFAYILRIAAVSERTIAVGPFVSQPNAVELERMDEDQPPEPGIDPGSEEER